MFVLKKKFLGFEGGEGVIYSLFGGAEHHHRSSSILIIIRHDSSSTLENTAADSQKKIHFNGIWEAGGATGNGGKGRVASLELPMFLGLFLFHFPFRDGYGTTTTIICL